MRLEVGVLFFLILNLVMYGCHGCGKEFDKAQGLHRHMNYCERAKTINQASNRTLQAATHKPSHAKLPRRQNNSQVENERRELRRQLNEDESEARLETSEEGPPVDFEPNDPGAGPSNAQLQAAPPLYTRSGRLQSRSHLDLDDVHPHLHPLPHLPLHLYLSWCRPPRNP
ncbi:hypothetical protein BC835DRAFT_1302516 [Cytidiella melzeri]|nr:hypothetical protein BC835DRAFT_1305271 [Cytidiella melzeri]KAI0706137.1 hypothetical protein BC835DRAFT_1302516 [Cytidiella melzeri]